MATTFRPFRPFQAPDPAPSPYAPLERALKLPYDEYPGQNSPASPTVGSPAPPPSAPAPSPVTPPPSPRPESPPAPPPATPPAPAAPPGGATIGGVHIGDYSADPILVQTKLLQQQVVADATAAALAQRKNLLITYGHEAGTDTSLYPDQNTVMAAEQNPFSTLANLGRTHQQHTRAIDEGTNNANLWYSGEHARELGNESTNYLGNRAGASSALQNALAGVDSNLLNAQRGADAANLSAEEAAMNRAIQFALQYGGTGSDAGQLPIAGNNVPGLTPGAPIVGIPPGTPDDTRVTPTSDNPAGIRQTPPGALPSILAPGQPGYNQLPPSATRDQLVKGGGIPSLFNAPYADDTRATQGAPGGGALAADPVAAAATDAGRPSYALVRNSTSLPGNAAPPGQSALYSADDPLAAKNVDAAISSGGHSGFWVPSHPGESAQAYAARVNALQAAHPGASIMLDIEGEGKGYPGTAGYQFTQDVLSQIHQGGTPISATVPGGGEDDFNYAPIVNSGGMVWIQTYGADRTQLFDPQTRYNMMLDRGVPPSQIGLMLMPGQQPIPGVPYSWYTIDDMQGQKPSAPAPDRQGLRVTPAQALIAALTEAARQNPDPAPTIMQSRGRPTYF